MKLFAATVIALGVLGLSAEASAFCRSTTCRSTGAKECATDQNNCPAEGAKLYWPTSCINFAFNQQGTQDLDPEETFAIMRKTFQAWTEVQCAKGGQATITFEVYADIDLGFVFPRTTSDPDSIRLVNVV